MFGLYGVAVSLRSELREVVRERGYERRSEPFALSSGGFSHDYVDIRRAVARGEDLELAGRTVALTLADIEFDAIGGMTMGADPVAHAVAMLTSKAWFSVRKATKEHGTGRRIEGAVLDETTRAVVFEDTVSTGRSLLEALDVVSSVATVVGICTILDRGESLKRQLEHLDVPYRAVLTYEDLGIAPI
jgi:orotate phosphoribosyltransferase